MIYERLKGFRYTHAIVGFGGTPTLWWMRFLKKGFYHCVVALGEGRSWIIIDPLLSYTDMIIIFDGNIKSFFKKNGYRYLHFSLKEKNVRRMSLMPYTCVETAKRFLGIQSQRIWTPFQLYRFIEKENRKIILDKESKMC